MLGLCVDLVLSPECTYMSEASYWQATTRLSQSDLGGTQLNSPPSASVAVVIGAGLMGMSIAYFLARLGIEVVIVERGSVGSGATGRNAGMIGSGAAVSWPEAVERFGEQDARAIWQFTLDNRVLLRDVLRDEQIVCDYRETGHLALACSSEELEAMQATVLALQSAGFDGEILGRDDVQKFCGCQLAPSVLGATYTQQDGQLHSAQFLYGLAAAAARHGARFSCGTQVLGLRPRTHGWDIDVVTDAGRSTIVAEHVFCATNAWLPELFPAIRHLVTPVRGQMIATAVLPSIFHCGMSADSGYQYWQQLSSGAVVLGGCRPVVADMEVGYEEPMLRDEVQDALDRYLGSLFIDLSSLKIEYRWAGIMGFTADALPLIGCVPGMQGLYVAGGCTGHGMPFGLRTGQLLAEACRDGVLSPALYPFRLDRRTLN